MPVDAHLREETILAHLPQVELLARRLHRRCPQVELEDLISIGTIGLIRAVDRFDPGRGCLVKTIAEHRIRGALLDYLRALDPLPRRVRRFQKERDDRLAGCAGEEFPETGELARSLGVTERQYRQWSAMIAASVTVSLESLPRSL